MEIKKPTLGSYESGRAEPKYADLIKIAHFFDIEIDELLKEDLSKRPAGIRRSNLRILATTVDSQNQENIEFVPVKAWVG